MVDVVIIGTMALDSVKTPFGDKKDILGGAATYASFAASFFSQPGIVAVVGDDFPEAHMNLLIDRKINLEGVKKEGKTFRWSGSYEYDMNEAKTLRTELNALETFNPILPDEYKDAEFVFLANIDPSLQLKVLDQIKNPKLVAMDTMNFWIEHKKDDLLNVLKKVDVILLNDAEARQLFNTTNLVKAARAALKLGPKTVIIKKGEHGALMFTNEKHFNAPGYPLEDVKDPTGAGDSFAGAFIGYLAQTKDTSETNMRKAVIFGSVIASFNAEDFSLERMKKLTDKDIEKRFEEMKNIREF
ncbi:MAG: sugar kinase [bacterium]|nr:sugar kinase [bacterium]